MALAPNGQRRITVTIAIPKLAEYLVQFGKCEVTGLGLFELTEDDVVTFTAGEDFHEDIDDARTIAKASAEWKRQQAEDRKRCIPKRL